MERLRVALGAPLWVPLLGLCWAAAAERHTVFWNSSNPKLPAAPFIAPPSSPGAVQPPGRASLAGEVWGAARWSQAGCPPPRRELLTPNGSPELWGQPGSASRPVPSLLQWGWPHGGRAFPSPAPPKKNNKKSTPKKHRGALCSAEQLSGRPVLGSEGLGELWGVLPPCPKFPRPPHVLTPAAPLPQVPLERLHGGGAPQRLPGHHLPALRGGQRGPARHGALHPLPGGPGGVPGLQGPLQGADPLGVRQAQRLAWPREVLGEVPALHPLHSGQGVQGGAQLLLHLQADSSPRGDVPEAEGDGAWQRHSGAACPRLDAEGEDPGR